MLSVFAWLMLSGPVLSAQKCDTVLVDKAYQEILYFYFQHDFYQALTQFEILQQACPDSLSKITQPGVDPQLLKGGISLAYGLDDQAAEIFNQLLTKAATLETQTQAWFLLGKSLFEKQQYQAASTILNKINIDNADQYLQTQDKDQWLYMQSQLFNWQTSQSITVARDNSYWLNELSDDSVFRQYVIYNQGLHQLQSNQYVQGIETLEQIGLSDSSFLDDLLGGWWSPLTVVDQTETDALRDRANLTIGYAHLKNQQALNALDAFNRVRLDSLDSDSALLGYGWAAAQREEYQIALSAWQRLQQQPRSNEYVMESYLASAYAFEQAFAPTQALDNLQRGLKRFALEKDFLRAHQQEIDDQYFIQLAKTKDWSLQIPAHLSSIMLSSAFRNKIAWLEESLTLQARFERWQQQLDTFSLMLDERQQEAQSRQQALKQNDLLSKLQQYQMLRDSLQAKLVQSSTEPKILAEQQELGWQARLERAQQRHKDVSDAWLTLNKKPLKPLYADRLKRLEGIMIWNASESYSKRRWQAQKLLNELDELIAQTAQQQAQLIARLNQTPEYPAQRQRIAQLQENLEVQQRRNQSIQSQQLASLNLLFVEQINQQIAQLESYELQAQLAVVRLNDKAYRKAEADKQGAKQ
ncbi:hypothetical protein Q4567_15080 [Aliiglaciecola sp. 2_MG-2023]|uniref:hypothetical protein n=1 Tax=unclassified Aliiglaciecola TaxID=2593648 RepID=UPI0026E1D619|nr:MULTISPECIES: hypothetical protein [unclassified Aliiglaciecola]MDO6712057.1 hypothetical protein [Aliiglaciecola sp. 2_MG-2023]MDO6754376.1 hypothetical protein [Aliiglaciecola sp. 1_MG-2023]